MHNNTHIFLIHQCDKNKKNVATFLDHSLEKERERDFYANSLTEIMFHMEYTLCCQNMVTPDPHHSFSIDERMAIPGSMDLSLLAYMLTFEYHIIKSHMNSLIHLHLNTYPTETM